MPTIQPTRLSAVGRRKRAREADEGGELEKLRGVIGVDERPHQQAVSAAVSTP